MVYLRDLKDVAPTVSAQMIRDGVKPPENVAKAPVLELTLVPYLEAFYELDSERTHGFSLARIPWSSIVFYADVNGMDVEETVYFIRKLDDQHLETLAKGMNNSGGPSGPSQTVQRPPRPD